MLNEIPVLLHLLVVVNHITNVL